MKAKHAIGWICLGLLLGLALPLHAKAAQDLARYLESEITTMEEAISACPTEAPPTEEGWYFKRFWLRLRPKASFGVPGAKIEIVPEVELLWDRAYPQGWVTYKPAS